MYFKWNGIESNIFFEMLGINSWACKRKKKKNYDNIVFVSFDNIMPLFILTLLVPFFLFLHLHFDNIMLVNINTIIFNIIILYHCT